MGRNFEQIIPEPLVRDFHDFYRRLSNSEGPPWVYWMGYSCLKCPLDLWIYQEILHEVRPDVVIEGGTASGGSALFLAHVMDALSWGHIVTIDWDADENRPKHPRISYVTGNTLSTDVVNAVHRAVEGFTRKVLILDDGHSDEHVYAELCLYAPFLQPGDVLIVEDTNLGGPLWGLDKYLEENPGRFEREPKWERLRLTFNPEGYLRCIA